MATNNAVNSGLAGTTGTGSFVGSTSPSLVTPTLGAATATSLTFSPTTGGIVGTTTNDNADAGKVGEFISSVLASGSAVSLTSTTSADITSISLTAGDWDVFGNIGFIFTGTTSPSWNCWISATSATAPDISLYSGGAILGALTTGVGDATPYFRASLSGTTTIYLSARANFAGGSATGCGGIYARRVR